VAEGKGLEFDIELDGELPELIHTDAKRLQQVLKNLLSNALKFTSSGYVKLRVERSGSGWSPSHPVLTRSKSVLAFSVIDTGIGIPKDKQKIIFEAFQQADGTTSRKYGGTGLGLSISRELARLLGGEIRVQSQPGAGSTFTMYLPQTYLGAVTQPRTDSLREVTPDLLTEPVGEEGLDMLLPVPSKTKSAALAEELVEMAVEDDRNSIQPGDKVLLIVEDDATFGRILMDLAHERGLKALVALRGATALSLAREFRPDAITLDINLPDAAGWTILDRLKHDPGTRHIPVHIISGDEDRRRGLALGAMTYLEKNVSKEGLEAAFGVIRSSVERRVKKVLVVMEDEGQRHAIEAAVFGDDLEMIEARNGGEALDLATRQYFDALIVDLNLNDMPVERLVAGLQREVQPYTPPVILYSREAIPEEAAREIRRLARTSVVRYAPSVERLLNETALLLHRSEADLSEGQREILDTLHQTDRALANRKVLVVDDDVRNIFALSSLLEEHNLRVIHAEDGRAGIELLQSNPGVDIVLMDIMMPEMDGYETMRAIRQIPEFRSLPIVALTAKAMKGDREKCLEAGASDYVTKPVDLDQLFSVLRVWISANDDLALDGGEPETGVIAPSSLIGVPGGAPPVAPSEESIVEDDRHLIDVGDKVLLIVEDDPAFARILVDMAHQRGLKALVALRGSTALALAHEFKPHAITLDITLPDAAGWTVLDRLKHDAATRHIPVHIISGDEDRRRGLALGAMTYLEKNVSKESLEAAFGVIRTSAEKRLKKVLVAVADESLRDAVRESIAAGDVDIIEAQSGGEVLRIAGQQYLDGLIVDPRLPETSPERLVASLQRQIQPYTPPVILYGRDPLGDEEAREIRHLSRSGMVRYAATPERLLNETMLLLHRKEADLSDEQRQALASLRQSDMILANRKVLVVDDDVRNIFALTSLLEEHNLNVLHAESGRTGLDLLQSNPDIDIVLMDIMMPEMDGYETMEAIRQIPQFKNLPIVALTAKAMKGDREKCLQAGASDYVTKPVDLDQLFSVLRVWILASSERTRSVSAQSETTGS
jgi:CheY-like chemotaxis protein